MRKTQHNGTGAVDGLPLVELSVHAGRYMQLTVGIEFHLTQGRQTTIKRQRLDLSEILTTGVNKSEKNTGIAKTYIVAREYRGVILYAL